MSRDAQIAIAGGLLSAFVFMALPNGSALALIFIYLIPFPIFAIGLGGSRRAATIAAGTGLIATSVFGDVLLAGIYGFVFAIPALLVTRIVMSQSASGTDEQADAKWASIGPALVALALLAAGLILMVDVGVGNLGLKQMLSAQLGDAFKVLVPLADQARHNRMIEMILPIFPGAVGSSWVLMTVFNAVIAQGVLVRLGRNLRPSPAYAELELPQWASWPLILSAGAALTGPLMGMDDLGYLGRNTAMVLALPYFFLGLAVVHTLARRVAATMIVLIVVYTVVLLSGWAALVIAGVGVTEHWIGLRARSEKSNTGPGSSIED